jgi:hypothetical protein
MTMKDLKARRAAALAGVTKAAPAPAPKAAPPAAPAPVTLDAAGITAIVNAAVAAALAKVGAAPAPAKAAPPAECHELTVTLFVNQAEIPWARFQNGGKPYSLTPNFARYLLATLADPKGRKLIEDMAGFSDKPVTSVKVVETAA